MQLPFLRPPRQRPAAAGPSHARPMLECLEDRYVMDVGFSAANLAILNNDISALIKDITPSGGDSTSASSSTTKTSSSRTSSPS
jgi:hypothetical protein